MHDWIEEEVPIGPETPAPTTFEKWEEYLLKEVGDRCESFGGMECFICMHWALYDFARTNTT